MEKKKKNNDENSRREFLKKLGIVGSGAMAAGTALLAGHRFEAQKDRSKSRIMLLAHDRKLMEVDQDALHEVTPKPLTEAELQKRGREGNSGKRFVFVVDLAKCRNARKCMDACQAAHHLRPEQHHINVLQMKDSPQTAHYFMPKMCQHCDNPPCVSVCPVDATFKRADGPVLIDNERCIGCRFCIAACPYSARSFNWKEPLYEQEDKGKEYDVELNIPQKKGTITKCLMSADLIREGELPYCVSACPNGVYYFGDEVEDAVTNGTTKETVRLSELLEKNGAYQLLPELGTKPRVYYLPPKNRLFPFPDELKDNDHHLHHI